MKSCLENVHEIHCTCMYHIWILTKNVHIGQGQQSNR